MAGYQVLERIRESSVGTLVGFDPEPAVTP
jgi:hypothetical protein